MNTIDFLQHTFVVTGDIFVGLAEDLRGHEMHRAFPGGNHAMWCVGHMACSDASSRTMVFGEPSPLEHWGELFNGGTMPVDDPSVYPAYDEVIDAFKQARADVVQRIARLNPADLDEPSAQVIEGFEPIFGTVGKALGMIATHGMHHRGQLADIRRSLQRQPLLA